MSGFQRGATYEQIKAYILEKHGLKVPSLYISQIKRKCGLYVGQTVICRRRKMPKCHSAHRKRKQRLWMH